MPRVVPCTTTYIRIVFSNIKYWFWRRSLCKQLMFISLKTSARARSHFCLDNNWFFIYSLSVAARRQRQIALGTFSHGTRISRITIRARYTFLAKSSRSGYCVQRATAGPRTRPPPGAVTGRARVSHVRSNTRDKTKTNVHSTQSFSQSPVRAINKASPKNGSN